MRMISTNEFRNKLAEYLEDICKTDTSLVISRFGRPLVKVIPYKKEKEEDFKKFFGFLKGNENGIAFENRVRRSKKERKYVEALRKGNG